MIFGNIHGFQMTSVCESVLILIIRDVNCEQQVSHAYSIFSEWERV